VSWKKKKNNKEHAHVIKSPFLLNRTGDLMRSGNSPSQIGYYVVVLMAKFIYVSRHISRYDTCTVWRIILIAISRPVIIVTIATRTWHGCILLWVHSVICDCQCVGRFIHCASQLSWRAKCTHESAYTLRFKKHSDIFSCYFSRKLSNFNSYGSNVTSINEPKPDLFPRFT